MIIKPDSPIGAPGGNRRVQPSGAEAGKAASLKNGAKASSAYQSNQTAATQGEQVTVSVAGKTMLAAMGAVKNAPDVRTERIEKLKRDIQEGNYQVDSKKVADKMLRSII